MIRYPEHTLPCLALRHELETKVDRLEPPDEPRRLWSDCGKCDRQRSVYSRQDAAAVTSISSFIGPTSFLFHAIANA